MEAVRITSKGISAMVLPFGARLMRLAVDTAKGPVNVVLGLDAADYVMDKTAMGAICGRYANRIGAARFTLDGITHNLNTNSGLNCLHGGGVGFGVQPWEIYASGPDFVTLRLVSANGDMGFPGCCEAYAIYRAVPHGLDIELEAVVDAPCPVNLVAHPYFNLHGHGLAGEHKLQIYSHQRLETGSALIPSGRILDCIDTPWDFTHMRSLQLGQVRFDNSYCLGDEGEMRHAAILISEASGIRMDVHTNQPSIQLYDGAGLPIPYSGLCLEVQRDPDAPNHPHFSPSVIRPGETSQQVLQLRFIAA